MYLNKNCKAFDAVRKVVLDERHTSRLENFNSTLLKYVLKGRVGYQYDALAAIDHNAHVFRKAAITASGKPKHNKNREKRVDDEESILRKVEIPKEHPKNIAQSIALKPIPKTSDLVNSHCQGLLLAPLHSHIQQQIHHRGMRKQHN
ncbi:Hypothetical predicted protein [Paramuricea clavata]|uniref:Uncharacterized protein n=1 Tax=Paramuricea clavata TaxID=317549 RepID=A0A7D9IPI4_PARCT|nr:Hypothetical predicted protein [Paramuricea clavata]